MEMINKLY